MMLKNGNTSFFIDPNQKPGEAKNDQPEIEKLMTAPES